MENLARNWRGVYISIYLKIENKLQVQCLSISDPFHLQSPIWTGENLGTIIRNYFEIAWARKSIFWMRWSYLGFHSQSEHGKKTSRNTFSFFPRFTFNLKTRWILLNFTVSHLCSKTVKWFNTYGTKEVLISIVRSLNGATFENFFRLRSYLGWSRVDLTKSTLSFFHIWKFPLCHNFIQCSIQKPILHNWELAIFLWHLTIFQNLQTFNVPVIKTIWKGILRKRKCNFNYHNR